MIMDHEVKFNEGENSLRKKNISQQTRKTRLA